MCLELEEVIFPLKKASWLLRFWKARMTSSVKASKSLSYNRLVLYALGPSIMGNDAVVYKWKYKYISGSAVKV